MIEPVVILPITGIAVSASVLAALRHDARVWQRSLVCYRLRFQQGLEADAVVELFTGLSGLVAPRGRDRIGPRAVVFEVVGQANGIEHHLLIPKGLEGIALSQLRAALPNVAVLPVVTPGHQMGVAGELAISHRGRPLRTDDVGAVAASLLTALQPLRDGEQMALQWTLAPTRPERGRGWLAALIDGTANTSEEIDPEARRAAKAKHASPLYQAAGRLGVVAESPARAAELLHRLTAALHAANQPGVNLYRRRIPSSWAARRLRARTLPSGPYPCLLNARELAGLVAFPIGSRALPGLELGGSKQLPPPADLPTTGRVIAISNFPGIERTLAITIADSLVHLHVMAPTGAGKSALLLNLIRQDIAAGYCVIVVDPKGDLIADILRRLPAHRVGDVVVLDPLDEERPVGLNVLAGAEDGPELVVERLVATFHQLWRDSWGPRTDDILRAGLTTLLHEPSMTLAELPLLLTDPHFRARLVGRLDDPVALEPFWGWYEGLSDAERAAAIGPVMNKLRAFLLRRRVRNVIGQPEGLDLDQVLADRLILLVPLPKGLLGEDAAALLGSLVVARLWQAVQRRAGLPAERRHPVFAHIDEVQDFLHLPTSLDDVLAQSRGLGLGLTLSHQHLGQLTTDVRLAVLNNARNRVLFALRSADARVMARELAPHIEARDLEGLGRFEVVVSLMADGRVVAPATGVTLPPPPETGMAEQALAQSRARFGRDRAEIERAMRARYGDRPGAGPVGRARRQP
ncbi:MAG: type IV secretory system conjugative DNA transfer family protein [Actinomycetota bacterium]|nr:type IV secretory system conjugative DNA transfer family protein [Actinomycetota bacterium]